MKFYQYKKACALLVTGALTAGMAVPAFAAETKQTEENTEPTAEAPKAEPMTLEEIQKLVLKNNRIKTKLALNLEKVAAGISAIDDGLKDLQDSQDDAARARKQASQAASQGQATIDATLGQLGGIPGGTSLSDNLWKEVSGKLLSGSV